MTKNKTCEICGDIELDQRKTAHFKEKHRQYKHEYIVVEKTGRCHLVCGYCFRQVNGFAKLIEHCDQYHLGDNTIQRGSRYDLTEKRMAAIARFQQDPSLSVRKVALDLAAKYNQVANWKRYALHGHWDKDGGKYGRRKRLEQLALKLAQAVHEFQLLAPEDIEIADQILDLLGDKDERKTIQETKV